MTREGQWSDRASHIALPRPPQIECSSRVTIPLVSCAALHMLSESRGFIIGALQTLKFLRDAISSAVRTIEPVAIKPGR